MSNLFEQFEINKIIPVSVKNVDLSFTNSSLCMLITVCVVMLSLTLCLRKRTVVPTMAQAFPETVYNLIQGIIEETLGKDGLKYFSFVFFLLMNTVLGIKRRGIEYLRTFFPAGIPVVLAPLIVPIEIISNLSRPFSLTIRLVVNMTVGHIILKVLGGFVVSMGIFGFLPLFGDFCIIAFEMFVALLQAYIYTVLSCVYLGMAVSGEE